MFMVVSYMWRRQGYTRTGKCHIDYKVMVQGTEQVQGTGS